MAEEAAEAVELRLLTDAKFAEEYEIIENEQVDRYAEGELTPAERIQFERHFLASDARRQKLRFAQNLRSYRDARVKDEVRRPVPFPAARRGFPAYLRAAAALLLVAGVGAGVWLLSGRRSDVEEGTEALRRAYRNQRTVAARVTGFDYAPLVVTRGQEPPEVDYVLRDRAERLLSDAVNAGADSHSRHALGRFYLASGQLDKSVSEFEAALGESPDSAQAHNDLGAAFLELGLRQGSGGGPVSALEIFAKSLRHFEKASELDPSLLEPLYNKALALQHMTMRERAREAWAAYLARDSQTKWAEEARRNLELLSERGASPPDAAQLLEGFLAAARAGDDERAWQLLSGNKEMITGMFLPQRLAAAYLREGAGGDRAKAEEFLKALGYAGELESKRARDPYVSHLAAYYSRSTPERRLALDQAQAAVADGYASCIRGEFKAALEQFGRARGLFEDAGDELEGRLCDYWIAYCKSQLDAIGESTSLLAALADYSRARGYRWLLGQALCWTANNHAELGEHSKSVENYNLALAVVSDIGDAYNVQKVLSQLASEYKHLGQPRRALEYHWRVLQLADPRFLSVRQLWRNYLYTTRTLADMGLYEAAAAFGGEMLGLAQREIREPGFIHYSYLYLGQSHGGLGRYEEAIRLTSESLKAAESVTDESARKLSANAVLQLAHLRRLMGDCAGALGDYDRAVETYGRMELSIYRYGAHKGRLLCYVALGDDARVESELSVVRGLFEEYRADIVEEQNRNTFFDREQSVYDIAIDHAYRTGDRRRAFDISEESRARSLLDSRNNSPRAATSDAAAGAAFASVTRPLALAELQARIPADVQVLQYAALDNKLLIWVVTSDSFHLVKSDVGAGDLQAKVMGYTRAMARGPGSGAAELGRELYGLVVGPAAGLLDPRKVVCIVPDKALSYLPFPALISPRSGDYLVADFAVMSSPSLNVFVLCSEASRGKAGKAAETILSVGNPAFDRAAHPALADLAGAAREARNIARDYYSAAYEFIGSDALKEPIRAKLPEADVIHFACHYVADERYPSASRLVLAKGGGAGGGDDLTAGELAAQKLPRAKLVVLSACRTGGESYYNGEGMVGISRTFLAAGVPLAVASQWAVDSESTAELMQRFHRYRKREDLPTAAALRRAQLDLLGDPRGLYRDPYYWAAFITVGGHADF